MASTWTWTYSSQSSDEAKLRPAPSFPTQGEAEAWLSEHWSQLAADGVSAVTLMCEQEPVYGPMSLSAE